MRVTDLERAGLLEVAALPGVLAGGVRAILEGRHPAEDLTASSQANPSEDQPHMPAPPPTPLARLHDTATQLGITVVDAADDDGPLLDDDTAAFVACGVCIAVNPGLDDDGLRADVLAMALALTSVMSPGATGHGGDITAAGGFVLISRTREAEPVSALGLLATVIAREHGHDTASAAFEYTVTVSELPCSAPRTRSRTPSSSRTGQPHVHWKIRTRVRCRCSFGACAAGLGRGPVADSQRCQPDWLRG